VVLDDPNEKGDAYSPTGRRRKLDWLNKDVMSVGGPGTNFLCFGTPIHRDAVVCDLSRNGAWQTRRYRSVVRWPERMDLWGEWERRLMNLADPDRSAAGWAFYAANRADMDYGAEVLWPERESLYGLMEHRAAVGPRAFATEKDDQEGTDGATEWPAEFFDRADLWFEDWPADVVYCVQALDPSKGQASKAGDYQAHVRVGLSSAGTLYVEADLRREDVTAMVGRALDLYSAWRPNELLAEGNNTMGLLQPEVERQVRERGRPNSPFVVNYSEVHHSQPKLARIRCVGGYLSRGQIRVRDTPGGRLLVDQWRDVPGGEKDDGPDAAATAVRRIEQVYGGRA